jgi:hypothetical protein
MIKILLLLVAFQMALLADGQDSVRLNCRTGGLPLKADLFVVDGVVQTLEDMEKFNPDNIASIDILKDAAKARTFSCKPVANVVIITTKRRVPLIEITDSEDGHALASATIELKNNQRTTVITSDEQGKASIKEPAQGSYEMTVSMTGYQTRTFHLGLDRNSVYQVRLDKQYRSLDTVIIKDVCIKRTRCFSYTCGGFRCTGRGIQIETVIKDTVDVTRSRAKVYPNPASANSPVTIQWPEGASDKVEATLLNASGQVMKSSTYQTGKTLTNRFDLPDIAAGLYFIRLKGNGIDVIEKLLVR